MSWLALDAQGAAIVAALMLGTALGLRIVHRRWAGFVAAAAWETGLICGLFALWQLANRLTHGGAGGLGNGRALWRLEGWLHLRLEHATQALIIGHPLLVRASNYYYAMAHLTGMFVFLVWLWVRHRDRYARWRNVLVLFTAAALLVEIVPVAPPRLLGNGTGLVDTAMAYGQSVYAFVGSGLADQYAALPSIHVGWALLIGVAVWRCSASRWRVLGPLHAALTVFVVVATANHFVLDAFAAAAVLALAWAAERTLRHALGRWVFGALPADDVAPQPVPVPG